MDTLGSPAGPDEGPGYNLTVIRADGRHRLCHLELDGHLLQALSRRGIASRVGFNVEPGPHTLRAVSGRSASAVFTLELVADRPVTVTIGRSAHRSQLWTLTAADHPDR